MDQIVLRELITATVRYCILMGKSNKEIGDSIVSVLNDLKDDKKFEPCLECPLGCICESSTIERGDINCIEARMHLLNRS